MGLPRVSLGAYALGYLAVRLLGFGKGYKEYVIDMVMV